MDVDADMDLICQFRTMNTNDKDHLINEFRRLSNTELSNEGCCFFLDLGEWNLNTALWAYYEYDAPVANDLPLMKFLCDITIGEGESVAPSTKFIKTWRIKNIGVKRWPYGCQLKLVNSNISQRPGQQSYDLPVHVKVLEPNEETDISIELISPDQCAIYQSQYRLFTSNGTPFGDPIWLILKVEQGGVLGITQQLNNVMFGMQVTPNPNTTHSLFNHFATSTTTTTTNNLFSFNNSSNNQQIIKSETTDSDIINNNSLTLNNNINPNPSIVNDNGELSNEKRPDFYDDMFS